MTQTQQNQVNQTVEHIKIKLTGAEAGHDWWHIFRVWKLAKTIAETEECDRFVVELGALLHDIADSKFYGGDEEIGPRTATEFLKSIDVDQAAIDHVVNIIRNISFKGTRDQSNTFKSIELDIVQDADRLDTLGAIGVARTFNYGGHMGRELYNPDILPNLNMTKEQYKHNKSSSLNHFFEKLLLLKDLMNTETGKQIAIHRHDYLQGFVNEFLAEWNGEV
jgi:uncharacterized protein